jgi:hypothetical protein
MHALTWEKKYQNGVAQFWTATSTKCGKMYDSFPEKPGEVVQRAFAEG